VMKSLKCPTRAGQTAALKNNINGLSLNFRG